ncbi:(2Fe-2S)-binding protein [Rhabdobacter roseus]|uniref:Nicotinate dehydrogenase subunit A n=1 Tax=Rhabdobacter roseus TaxID=1655419 RepID=A0A840TRZ9_9BACT|nr:(2Fe-2S)-binding protein [Rhabdobacter roseus]MBB5284487.1 nicotinate dehydrogenase subunit A [Rhabdobacter roseus]
MEADVTIEVNGKKHMLRVDPATPLLYVLRNQLELNGPKYGCGLEQCGSCMVLMDGVAMPSCRVPVESMQGRAITTLEGLTRADGALHPVQQAFVNEQAAQCGYCLNGMVISAVALLQANKKPDEAAIREGLQRVLCRCSVQPRVIRAVQRAAGTLQ